MDPQQTQPPVQTLIEQKSNTFVWILVSIFTLLIISGLITWKFTEKESVSAEQQVVVKEEENWKTYRNEEYGFEFKYPQDWVKLQDYQNDSELITVFSSPETINRISGCYEGCGPDLWFYRYKNINLEKYINDQNNLIFHPKKIMIDNQVAYEADEAGFGSYYVVLIQKGNDMYKILSYNNELSLASSTAESKILKTFKFIDKTATSSDSRILLTEENIPKYAGYDEWDSVNNLPKSCLEEFNYDPANEIVKYSSNKWGLSFDIPYNKNWGNSKYRINPYEEILAKPDWVRTQAKIIQGYIFPGEGCGWYRNGVGVYVDSKESADEVLKQHNNSWNSNGLFKAGITKINNLQVVQYYEGDMCEYYYGVVMGKKYNYTVVSGCNGSFSQVENTIKTIKLLE